QFLEVGTATVSGDGQRIETSSNAITEAAIYFVASARQTTTVIGRALDADRTPVRRAMIRARGQEQLTDGNGGFILRNVPVLPGTDQLTVEASLLRPNGRVERLTRAGIPVVKDGITNVSPELIFGSLTANQPPVLFAPNAFTANAGQTNDLPFFASDADSDQPVNVTVTGASFATIIRNATLPHLFTLRLTPVIADAGDRTLTLTATDNQGATTTQTLQLTVVIPNRPPVANDQRVTTDEDTPKAITLTASDPDNSPLTWMILSAPAKGSLSGSAPNVTYTPNKDFNGADSFTFKVRDGEFDSNTATVTITVNPVNDAPVLTVPGAQTVKEGELLSFTVSATDVDEGQTLKFTAPALPSGASFNETTRTFTWTPTFEQAGSFTATFAVMDNGTPSRSDSKNVTITVTDVNRAPTARAAEVMTDEDKALPIVLAGSDPDGDTLSFMIVAPPMHGSLSGSAPNLTYTPAKDYNGADAFTFKVNDGKLDSAPATISITVKPVNDPPVLTVPGPQTVKEGETLTFTISATDVDTGQTLKFTAASVPSGASFNDATRTFAWTPNFDQAGTYTVSFTVMDNGAPVGSDTKSVTITVTDVNRAPVARAAEVMTDEDKALAIVLAGSDPDGNTLTYAVVTQPAKGVLTGTAPNLTYTPNKDYNGPDSFTFKVNDGKLDSPPATISIIVKPVNDAPVATAQQVTTDEDTAKAITLTGSDVDGDALTFMVVTPPAHGLLSGTAPNLTYTPAINYNGADAFTFKVNDGKLDSAPAPVSITVRPVADPPRATAQTLVTDEDKPVQFTLAGVDPDGGTLRFMIVTQPRNGLLLGTPPALTYTPRLDFNGSDSFTFKVNNGSFDSPPVTVNITINGVNDPPVLSVPPAQTVAEGQTLTFTVSATDPDSPVIKITAPSRPSGASFIESSRVFTWTPNFDQAGTYTVNFVATDDGTPALTDAKSVQIIVTNTNRAPRADAKTVTTNEDTPVPIVLSGSDPDGDAITTMVVTQPQRGKLSGNAPNLTYTPNQDVNGTDSFTYKANDGSLDSPLVIVTINIAPVNDAPVLNVPGPQTVNEAVKLSFNLSATDVDTGQTLTFSSSNLPNGAALTPDGMFMWTPTNKQAGSYTVNFTATDNGTPALGNSKSVAITVVNPAPVAASQNVTLDEDTPKAIVLVVNDLDGDALTYTIVNAPQHGALSGTAPNLTYTPALNYNGADSFSFKANDGSVDSNTATVSLTINSINDRPVLNVPPTQAVNEGVALSFTVTATDVDAGQTLTFSAANVPQGANFNPATATFTWTPTFAQAGDYTVNFTVTDNGTPPLADAKAVLIRVVNVNRGPTANAQTVVTDEDTAKQFALTGSDPDGDALTFTIVTPPTKGALTGTAPNLTYTPQANVNGADAFTFKVSDGSTESAVATVSITINPVNDKPTITVPGAQTVAENQLLTFSVLGSDVDTGQTLTLSAANVPSGASFAPATGVFSWTPNFTQAGSYTVTFTVADNGTPQLTDAKTVTITVTDTQRAPTANGQQVMTDEDTALPIVLTGSDPDGDPLTFMIVTPPANGSLSGTAPNVTYTPRANFNGADAFTFKVNDGKADSNTATVSITVKPVNDAPVATPQSVQAVEDTARPITLTGTDVDGDTLTFMVVTPPAKGTLSGTAPNLTYTPNANATGEDAFTFKVNDGKVDSAAATVSITIGAVNDPPVANAQQITTDEDASKQIVLTASDPDNDPLTFVIVTPPAHGTLNGNAPNLLYLPNPNYNGADSFTFKANDGKVDSNVATVSLTINPINDPPIILVPGAQMVDEGTQLQFTVTASDVDGTTPTLSAPNLPTGAAFNASTGLFSWTPNFDQMGTYTLNFTATDNGTPPLSDTKAVTITVKDARRTPIANGQQVTTDEDTAKPITLTGSDPDNVTITFMIVSQPQHGTLTGTPPAVMYVPAANYNGPDVFTFKVNNGALDSTPATVNITVNPINDAPTISAPDARTATEGETISFTVTSADVDTGQTLTLKATGLPPGATFDPGTGVFSWTPAFNQSGSYSVTFMVTDNGTPPLSAMKTTTFTINDINRPPIANSFPVTVTEDTATPITLTGSDPDGDTFTFAVVAQPMHGTLTGTAPNLTYTPALNYNGPDSFTFKTNDGKVDSVNALVTITVNPVNDKPVITVPGAQNVTAGQTVNFTVTASDVDTGDVITLSAANVPQSATFNAATGVFNWTPSAAATVTVSFTATDNGTPQMSDTKTVTITVGAVNNRPPSCTNVSATTDEDVAKQFALTCSDPENAALSYSIVTPPQSGTVTLNGATATYTPNQNFNGQDSFTFKANDGSLDSPAATATITVTPVCDPPVLTVPGAQTVAIGDELIFTVTASDPDTTALTLTATNLPSGATFIQTGNAGEFRWRPAAGTPTGPVTVTFSVTDDCVPTALMDSKTVTITVSQTSQEWAQLTGPEGGKIIALATVNSTNLFAATQGGGIFRTTNNGGAWTPVNKGLTNLKVLTLAARNGVLYAGTEGDGVFRSLDNGDNWSPFNTGLNDSFVFFLAASDTYLYAVTGATNFSNQTIQRTPLNEAGWAAFNTNLVANVFSDLQLAGTKLFAATLVDGVFATDASTAGWSAFNTGFPNNEPPFINSLTASGTTLFAGTDAGVFSTPTDSAAWTTFNTGLDASARIVTVEALGTNLYARAERLMIQPVASTLYDVVKSPVARASWSTVNTGIFNRAVNTFAQTDGNIFAGTEGSGVFRTTDAGANWAQANSGLNAAFILSLFVKDTLLFAGLDGGGIYVSSNNGQSWTAANTGLTDLFPFGANAFATDGTALYAGTNGRGVYRSTDNGANWTSFNDAGFTNTVVKDLLISSNKLFAATGDTGLYNSPLSSPVWTSVSVSGFTVEATALFKTAANLFLGTGSGTVYRSSDLTGTSWAQVGSGLEAGIPITSFALRGATNLFTGRNGDGAWRSTNNGDLFTRMVNGLDNQNVVGLRSDATRLYAATNGGGVYVTTDDGANWKQIIINLTNLRTRAITIKDNVIFVGTEGSGIYNRPVKD
ncbi:MAG: tandem-95 repeat protein, partial [Acidobacteria bacterium]|nr:tandem-95 repeat protein [Acidobacteriota bacterium]